MSKAWQIVAALFFVACLNYSDRSAVSAVFPLLRADLRLTDLEIAATGSFFLWAYALGSPVAGRIADRVSRSRMVIASLVAWSLITLGTGFVTSTSQLLGMRVLLGVAECAYLPAAIALIADHHAAKSRATAMGVHIAGLNLGLVAGAALAGYVGERHGWRVSFFVLGGAGLVLALIGGLALTDAPKSGERIGRAGRFSTALRGILSVPSYSVVVIQAMLIAIGIWAFINWLPLYFRETYGFSLAGAGFSGTFMLQSGAVLGILAGGYLSDAVARFGLQRRMLFQAICYFAGTPFPLAFLGHPAYALLSMSIFAFSFCRSLGSSNEHAIVCDLLPQHLRSTAIGFMNSANCLAGGIGILIAGTLKQHVGLSQIFAGVSGIMLLASFLVLFGYRFLLGRDLELRNQMNGEQNFAWLPAATGKTAT